MKVFTAQQMRDFDRAAVDEYSIPSIVLMENAALRVVEFLEIQFKPLKDKNIVVLCGKGNNGGDGFAIARHLLHASMCSDVVACGPTELTGDALVNYQAYKRSDIPIEGLEDLGRFDLIEVDDDKLDSLSGSLAGYDIVVDALLGTGFRGAVTTNLIRSALQELSCQGSAIRVAVDIPSALNADSGEAAPEAVGASYTVTFASPKRGMFLRDGPQMCGEIWVGEIGTVPGADAANRDWLSLHNTELCP
jgi:NAD(P)H-hydrate epimerase